MPHALLGRQARKAERPASMAQGACVGIELMRVNPNAAACARMIDKS
jgi:hypothetical protein